VGVEDPPSWYSLSTQKTNLILHIIHILVLIVSASVCCRLNSGWWNFNECKGLFTIHQHFNTNTFLTIQQIIRS